MVPGLESRAGVLFGIGVELAARKIQSLGIDILIDLSGLTLHSGLEILGLRPSPLQISFLGFPMSTGTKFVDYFITDSVAVDPASDRNHFIEHLLFTPPSFFVNDYAQVQSHVMWRKRPSRAEYGSPENGIVFACFSNFGKMCKPCTEYSKSSKMEKPIPRAAAVGRKWWCRFRKVFRD